MSSDTDTQENEKVDGGLLTSSLEIVNIGIENFSDSLVAQGASVVQVTFRPNRIAQKTKKLVDALL